MRTCIMVGFEECRKHYRHPEKVVVTGTPGAGRLFRLDQASRPGRSWASTDGRPLIVSFWGSLGATVHERADGWTSRPLEVADGHALPPHPRRRARAAVDAMSAGRWRQEDLRGRRDLDVREYIHDMADRHACGGSGDLPGGGLHHQRADGPGSAGGHRPLSLRHRTTIQEKNARILEQHGGARGHAGEGCHRRKRSTDAAASDPPLTPELRAQHERRPWRSWASPTPTRAHLSAPSWPCRGSNPHTLLPA